MKKIIQIVLAVMVIASMTGCASTKGYFVDRGRDAAEIVSVSCGLGLGAKARCSVVNVGFYGGEDASILRGTKILGPCRRPDIPGFDPRTIDLTLTLPVFATPHSGKPWLHALEDFREYSQYKDARGKDFSARGYYVPAIMIAQGSPAYYTQIEVAVGLGPSLRLGFNPGELLDFLFGWFGIDIFNDDLEARQQKEQSNQVPEDTARKLADPQH